MDLDSSLDDLIRKRKTNKPNNQNQKQHNGGKKQRQTKSRPSIQVQSKAKVTKPQRNSGINARLVYGNRIRVFDTVINFSFFVVYCSIIQSCYFWTTFHLQKPTTEATATTSIT